MQCRVTLKVTEAGGRPGPFSSGFCPDLKVGSENASLAIRVIKVDGPRQDGWLYPGESGMIEVEPVYPNLKEYKVLTQGCKFEILEGSASIGTGEIIQA